MADQPESLTFTDIDIHSYNYICNILSRDYNIPGGALVWHKDQTLTVNVTAYSFVSDIRNTMHRRSLPLEMDSCMYEKANLYIENENTKSDFPNVYATLDQSDATSESFDIIIMSDSDGVEAYLHKLKVHLGLLKTTKRQTRMFESEPISQTKEEHLDNAIVLPQDYFITFEKIEVFVAKKNILELDGVVECLVNPTNSQLTHKGKVSILLAEHGGSKYKRACDKLIPVGTTKCACSTGGNLQTKRIIHAACPLKSDYMFKTEKHLADAIFSTVFNCLKTVEDNGFSSVALPFICTGQAGIPVQMCCRQYVSAILEFSRQRKHLLTCTQIHLVDIEDEKVKYAQEIFVQYLPKKFSQRLEIPTNYDTVYQISEQMSTTSFVDRTSIPIPKVEPEREDGHYDTAYSDSAVISSRDHDNVVQETQYETVEARPVSYGDVGGRKRHNDHNALLLTPNILNLHANAGDDNFKVRENDENLWSSSVLSTLSELRNSEGEVGGKQRELKEDYKTARCHVDAYSKINDSVYSKLTGKQFKDDEKVNNYELNIKDCKVLVYKGDIRNIYVDAIVCPEDLSLGTETNGLVAASIKVKYRHSYKPSKLKCLSTSHSNSTHRKTVATTEMTRHKTNKGKPANESSLKTLSTGENADDEQVEEGIKEEEEKANNIMPDDSPHIRYILHVATPFWKPDSDNRTFTEDLEKCVGAVFEKIEKHNKKRKIYSVAFPLMGISEVDEDSIRKSCRAMAKCIHMFCQGKKRQKSDNRVGNVHIVNRCKEITDIMWQELNQT